MGTLSFDSIEQRFSFLAHSREDTVSAAVFDSRARNVRPADEWSDLDIISFVSQPAVFAERQEWISGIGETMIAFGQPNVFGAGSKSAFCSRAASTWSSCFYHGAKCHN